MNYLDGGLSNSLPVLDSKTIRVSPFAGGSHICPKDNNASSSSSRIPDNVLTNKVKKSLAGQEMEMSAPNVRRLMNTFKPSSDLDGLYQQGYDLTQSYIDDAEKIGRHFYDDDDHLLSSDSEPSGQLQNGKPEPSSVATSSNAG